jgi:hypothetical protein
MTQLTEKHRVLAAEILEHAKYHYSDGGWDVIVECMGLDDIAQDIADYEEDEQTSVQTVTEALAAFESRVDVWSDQQKGAIIDGYGSEEAYEASMRGEW